MTRALVTGGSGFIGSALCSALVKSSHGVTSLDNDSRNSQRVDGVEYFVGSVTDDTREASWQCALHPVVPDSAWHLAAINGTKNFYDRPADVLDVQIRGTRNVIDACLEHGIKALVLFSSSEVYQTPPVIPTPEEVPLSIPDITNPRYSYAIGKIAAEAMCWHSAIEKVVVIRPHNVFGPNMGFEHVIPQFILRAARTPDRATFDIYGSTTRSFIYIDDFTDAMMAIWKKTESTKGRVREIYHVGTEDLTSTTALAGQICRLMGRVLPDGRYPFKFKTHEAPAGGTRSRCPDTRKVRALGWEPKVSLEEGLRRTIEAYRAKESEWPA
jgi:nucleoside-diphosphate-sugar epimerase